MSETDLKDILDQEANRLSDDEPKAEEAEGARDEVEGAEVSAETVEPETAKAEPAEAEPKDEPKAEDRSDAGHTVPLARLNEVLSQKRALEEQLRQMSQQPKGEQPKAPDMFADPEAYTRHVETIAEERARNHALNMSEYLARETYGEKVDQAYEALQSATEADRMRVMAARSPWHELVKWHDERRAAAEIGNPDDFRRRVRDEVRAELEAEMAAKQVREKPAPAPSLATETSVGDRGAAGWSGPTDLSRIIG